MENDYAAQRRVNFRENFKENFFPIKVKIDNYNFMTINNFRFIMEYHFKKNEIPFIDDKNCNNTICNDFRYGNRFKKIMKKNILFYGNIKNFFFNIFMDDTKIHNKKVKVCYLQFLNDSLIPLKKKFIYTIICIDYNIFKKIKNKFYEFMIKKIEKEFLFVNDGIKGNLFSIICDNLECNDILNLKNSFISQDYQCRICDSTISNISTKLNNYNLKSNDYYLKQIQLNNRDKNLSKINKINGVSPFFYLEDFDYISSVIIEIQHTENEGELFRDLVLFFIKFQDLVKDKRIENIKDYLKENYNVEKKKIDKFFEELPDLKKKIINPNNDLEIEETNTSSNNNKKKNKKKPLGSSDIYYFFNSLIIFFYDFFLLNKENDIIKIYLFHYNYYKILQQNTFIDSDLNYLNYLVKQRVELYIKLNLKIVPKTLLSLHYNYYIQEYGPIKYFTSFMFENHNHIVKRDVSRSSRNLSVSSLKLNYCFFEYNISITIPKINNDFSNLKKVQFIRISNNLIKPFSSAIYLGNS